MKTKIKQLSTTSGMYSGLTVKCCQVGCTVHLGLTTEDYIEAHGFFMEQGWANIHSINEDPSLIDSYWLCPEHTKQMLMNLIPTRGIKDQFTLTGIPCPPA